MTEAINNKFIIAEASSRASKKWKTREYTWEEFVDRLSTPKKTQETVEEYHRWKSSKDAAEKEKAGNAKDIGGFVGGALSGPQRVKSAVVNRCLICLDIDEGDNAVWDDWQRKFGWRAVLYSTHSHTVEKPRLRLIVPLAVPVSPDQYVAISLKLIEGMGEERFDPSTTQIERMMYWPSCPSDGEYVFENNGTVPLLDGETFLKENYDDWTDQTTWPTLKGEQVRITKEVGGLKKQDPTTIKGWAGIFCKEYPIEEAIATFLSEQYEESDDKPGRYSYTGSSTANGLVILGGMFAYSHHASDPACGQALSAFDLVRVHKFGDLDDNIAPETPMNKRPSFKAMEKFCREDARCRIRNINERTSMSNGKQESHEGQGTEDAQAPETSPDTQFVQAEEENEDGAAAANPGNTASDEWKADLEIDKYGGIAANHKNVELILENDAKLKGYFGFDEFKQRVSIIGKVPWKRRNNVPFFSDSDENQLVAFMDKKYGIKRADVIVRSLENVADEHSFHPVRDYLNSLKWDRVPRIGTLLRDYFRAADSPYVRAAITVILIGAVKRVFDPGCQFDTMLTLFGPQGIGKSRFIKLLVPKTNWRTDNLGSAVGTKDSMEALLGVWLVEMAELAALKKADADTIKNFVTTSVDHFRPAYGRRTMDFPRQCVFFATTNTDGFLNDVTGNRRFLIVDVTPVGDEKPEKDIWTDLPKERDQVWAEAKYLYDQGAATVLTPEMEKIAEKWQERFLRTDSRRDDIEEYLSRKYPAEWETMCVIDRKAWLQDPKNIDAGEYEKDSVCIKEITAEALNLPEHLKLSTWESNEIRNIVTNLKNPNGDRWEYQGDARRNFPPYRKQRYFKRIRKKKVR